ncbi:MAG TPA: hypothetical protein VLS25_02520 [Dehalococcoidia bacterium]|nr:hypothetical protein [Dehalococcoidia bacterium]
MSPSRLAGPAAIAATAALLMTLLFIGRGAGAADPGSMEAMSIDMDIAGNDATTLGPWDQCIVASPGDTITIDVTATNIPAAFPMIAFAFTLNFPAGVATVTSADPNLLLASIPGSSILDVSEALPDGGGDWNAAVVDTSVIPPESGSGVLDRIALSIDPGAGAGLYPLGLTAAAHIDLNNDTYVPAAINNAFLAIGTTCENLPTPSPTPEPTPTPPPTPLPFIAGDVDCDGLVVALDARKILQFSAGLPVLQNEPCPNLGLSSVADVDCDGYTNPRDALSIVRVVSALFPLSSQPGCPAIGTGTGGAPYPVPAGGTATPGPNGYAVSVSSANAGPGGPATVTVRLSAPAPGIGAYSIDLMFDRSGVAAVTGCEILGRPTEAACNPAFEPGKVRITGVVNVPGQSGGIDLASITFQAGFTPGVFSLGPQPLLVTDPDGGPRTTSATSGTLTISTSIPTPTPTPTPTPGPSPVPGEPPPFDPGGVVCLDVYETSGDPCDGDMSPGASSDIRTTLCFGWNPDCSVRDNPVNDSNFGDLLAFTPPGWHVPGGSEIPVGTIVGRADSEVTLGLLNNPCNNRVQVSFTLLNGSINTADVIQPRPEGLTDPMQPLAMDANGNGIPDGAERYPSFVNQFLGGAQPRERLFGVTNTMGAWIPVNILVFEPGATINWGGRVVTFSPDLGYPAILILLDPTAQPAPSAITDFCAPLLVQYVLLGQTLDNPCTPVPVVGANCPVRADFSPDFTNAAYPSFPCDARSKFDDDHDGKINDGCPQVGAVAETGAQCDNDFSDDSEDSNVNDGCPAFGAVSEGARIPGACSGGDEGGCIFRSNPAAAGASRFTTLDVSQRDADGDGIENNLDVCALIPNSEWNPRVFDTVHDPDGDGLPSVCDPSPTQSGPGSPTGCRSGYVGPDQDQDCFPNRADNCPTVTQLLDPSLPANNFLSGGVWNPPLAPDQDRDSIGDACDPHPSAPDGNVAALCLDYALNVGGAAGPVVGTQEPMPGPDCALAGSPGPAPTPPGQTAGPTPTPTPSPTPTPTPTPTPPPAPPLDINVSIDENGEVVPRDGVATVHGSVACDRPAMVELEVQVAQRAGRSYLVGTGHTSVWCDGSAGWTIQALPNGRFAGGWAEVTADAHGEAGGSHGSDSAQARVQLKGGPRG